MKALAVDVLDVAPETILKELWGFDNSPAYYALLAAINGSRAPFVVFLTVTFCAPRDASPDAPTFDLGEWATANIGPFGERWFGGFYDKADVEVMGFVDPSEAAAFRIKWHGTPL